MLSSEESGSFAQGLTEFHVDATVIRPSEWPEEHREVFATIYQISNLSFEDYEKPEEEGGLHARRANNLQTAKSIVSRAHHTWLVVRHEDLWHIYSGRIEDLSQGARYCLSCQWESKISSLNGAVQVLLIVDHISIWAREVYRKFVLEQLRRFIYLPYRSESSQCPLTPEAEKYQSEPNPESLIEYPSSEEIIALVRDLNNATPSQTLAACVIRTCWTKSLYRKEEVHGAETYKQMSGLCAMSERAQHGNAAYSQCLRFSTTLTKIDSAAVGSGQLIGLPMLGASTFIFGLSRFTSSLSYGLCNMVFREPAQPYKGQDLEMDIERAFRNDEVYFTTLDNFGLDSVIPAGYISDGKLRAYSVSMRLSKGFSQFRLASFLQAWFKYARSGIPLPCMPVSGRNQLVARRDKRKISREVNTSKSSPMAHNCCMICGQGLDLMTGETLDHIRNEGTISWQLDSELVVCKNVLGYFTRVEQGKGLCLLSD